MNMYAIVAGQCTRTIDIASPLFSKMQALRYIATCMTSLFLVLSVWGNCYWLYVGH